MPTEGSSETPPVGVFEMPPVGESKVSSVCPVLNSTLRPARHTQMRPRFRHPMRIVSKCSTRNWVASMKVLARISSTQNFLKSPWRFRLTVFGSWRVRSDRVRYPPALSCRSLVPASGVAALHLGEQEELAGCQAILDRAHRTKLHVADIGYDRWRQH